jgi:hypothetical protein
MRKKKVFWVLLAAGIAVISIGVVSAQRIDGETLTRILSGADESRVAKSPPEPTAAAVRAGMREVSKKDSLVGSWIETATFDPTPTPTPSASQSPRPTASPSPSPTPRVITALTTFHDDGTLAAYDQGNVTIDPNPPKSPSEVITGSVFSAGNGVWKQKGPPRTFVYTQRELMSDLSGNLIGFLHVRGNYTLSASGHTYTGRSFAQLFVDGEEVFSGWVTNAGERILLEHPPPDPQR